MVTLLLTSVFVLGLLAIAIYFWQKPANNSQTIESPLPPPHEPRGLFSDYQQNELKAAEDPAPKSEANEDQEVIDQAIKTIRDWQQSPDKNSTAKMLHVAALSNDAETYRKAVEIVLQSWREGKLRDLSAAELQSLFNSEFWVLSSASRSSGAGFVLKRTLSSANRELEPTNNP